MQIVSGISARAIFRARPFALFIAMLVYLANGLPAHGATPTIKLSAADTPDAFDFRPSGCLYPSADGGLANYAMGTIAFNDPLPQGSIVTQIDLRVSFLNGGVGLNNDRGSTYFALNVQYDNQFTERTIGSALPSAAPPRSTCGDPPYVGFEWKSISGPFLSDGLPYYRYQDQNVIMALGVATGTEPSRNFGVDHPYVFVEKIEITLHYEPPPTIELDITNDTSVDDRKILIHRWRDEENHPYPSRFQRLLPGSSNADRDRRIDIGGTVKYESGATAANRTVYLRVADPPDTSQYVPKTSRLPGDNGAWLGGVLDAPVVTTDNNGRFHTVLTGSEIAGDNYRVEASTVPNFGFSSACGLANNCFGTGTITNWKRAYVEYDRMFRVGGMLTATASAGQDRVIISYNKKFKKNQTVRLIHAPRTGEPLANFYSEDAVITDTIRNQSTNTLTLVLDHPLARDYYPSQTSDDQLGDAAGLVTFDDEEDFYNLRDTVNDYATPLFADAFVDYRFLSSQYDPVPYLPYVKDVRDAAGLADHWFVNRVLGTAGQPIASANHQHLLAGSTEQSAKFEGRTGATGGTNFSWLWIDRIEGSGHANAAQWRNIGENTAHEIGHQWHINQDKVAAFGSEHCDPYKQYNSTVLFCTMHSTADGPEFNDGRVAFHYLANGDVDSEYVFIRRRPEPIPLP